MICTELTREEANRFYLEAVKEGDTDILRKLCREDLFFLLTVACNRKDIDKDWLYARCREVEADPDGHIDLWARDHYKSTIITFGQTMRDILNDSNCTFGIFSHTRPIAKGFLDQIKREFETNTFLKDLFPDILYQNPQKEAPKWSLDGGIIVRRDSNPKESTVEAWGLVDGQPTSKHFSHLVYDDVVTKESVSTPEMIQKTTDAWALSTNLESSHDERRSKVRYIGTRYHKNDTYRTIIDRKAALPRIYAGTHDGKETGRPVLLAAEVMAKKRRDMGPYIFAAQILQNPTADDKMGFKLEWLNYYTMLRNTGKWNFYLLVDPASKKKTSSDYTVMVVVGLAPDGNYYLVDGVRDRLNLTERCQTLFRLHRQWAPLKTGYEHYGMQADIEHIKYVMEIEGYRFQIIELGGSMPKNDRIQRLVPDFEQNRFYLPHRLMFSTVEKKAVDFVHSFVNEEFLDFPVASHDDMLDCISRIKDEVLLAVFPKLVTPQVVVPKPHDPLSLEPQSQSAQTYDPLAMRG